MCYNYKERLENLNIDYLKEPLPITNDNNYNPNIFEILQIENKEVLYCRLLGSLLDQNSKINNGSSSSLKSFAQECGFNLSNDISESSVILEEKIDADRRVDIVIRINGKVYPIEVKINAEDQKYQLYDYWHYYFDEKQGQYKSQKDKIIYYLTPTGKKPSKDSKKSLKENDYKCISFNENIINWLKKINYNKNETANYILEQYKRTVEKMCQKETEKNYLYNAIGFNDENNTDNNEYKKLLIAILNNAGDITNIIKQNYLVNKFGGISPFEFCKCIDEEDYTKDKHCLLTIKKDGNKIAWICADTNLYIVAEKVKEGRTKDWTTTESKDYIWRYIDNGSKRFDIGKNINRCLDDVKLNDIKKILEDIDA